MSFAFNPATGLRNTTTYVSKPVSGTAAREQIQGRLDEIRDYVNKHGIIVDDTGIVNAIVITLAPVPSANTDLLLNVKIKVTNTGAATINVNNLGNVAIKKMGIALHAGELVANSYAILIFDGTYFELLNPHGSSESFSENFTNTSQSIDGLSTYNLSILLPFEANLGSLVIRSTSNSASYSNINFSTSSEKSWGIEQAGLFNFDTIGYSTSSMFGPSHLYIRILYVVIVSNSLIIRFENTNSSPKILDVCGYYQVFS
jgi:hypothetical protein